MLSQKYFAILPVIGLMILAIVGFNGCEQVKIGRNNGTTDPVPTSNVTESDTATEISRYLVKIGDTIKLTARPDPDKGISGEYEVAENGTIKLLHIGRVDVEGFTATEIEDKIEKRYEDIYSSISITVTVLRYYIVRGEIRRPGRYGYTRQIGILEGITSAGGFTDFSKKTKVIVTRKKSDGTTEQNKVNCKKIRDGKAKDFMLKPDDQIFVPHGAF